MRLSSKLNQTAVYWGPAGWDGFGKPAFGSPEELSVRWEEKTEEFIDEDGTRKLTSAVVYLNAEVEHGGKLMLGTLDDLDSNLSPPSVGAWEIQQVQNMPSVRGTETLRMVLL